MRVRTHHTTLAASENPNRTHSAEPCGSVPSHNREVIPMTPKKLKLADIVKDAAALKKQWASTQPAADLNPIPTGRYTASLDDIRPDASRGGTPRLKITLTVADGEH